MYINLNRSTRPRAVVFCLAIFLVCLLCAAGVRCRPIQIRIQGRSTLLRHIHSRFREANAGRNKYRGEKKKRFCFTQNKHLIYYSYYDDDDDYDDGAYSFPKMVVRFSNEIKTRAALIE